MPITKLRPSFTFDEDRLNALKAIVPEAFADGKINWETLKEALGEHLEDEMPDAEHFGLTWPGKRAARRLAAQPSTGALRPAPGEGVNEETTRHLFIEGDNLEVLKLLQKSYAGRVKMIYIDPPYNTGNDFVYKDDYKEPLEDYLRKTGQASESGELLTSNTKADGRYHSNWLSMMYPRLILARQLLREDGVLFVSIDDNEVYNLRHLISEVFGNENFVANLTVLCNPKGRSQDKYFATNHEYLMVYSRNPLLTGSFAIEKGDSQIEAEYAEEDGFGKYRLMELRNTHREFGRHNRPNLWYPLYVNQKTHEIVLEKTDGYVRVLPTWDDGFEGCWTWDKEKALEDIDLLTARLVSGTIWRIYRKSYANNATQMLKTILMRKEYATERGQKALGILLNTRDRIFQSPKSVDL